MRFLADRITSRHTLMINLSGQAIFLVLTNWAGSPVVMRIAVPLFGYFHGAFGALFQLVVQDAFVIRLYGSIMGSINLSTIVSFGIGTILGGRVLRPDRSYTTVFVTVAVLFITGALSLTQASVPDRRPVADEVSTK